jgi:hypothetical protein
MKRNKIPMKPTFKNTARESLPLLRGMFVSPRLSGARKNSALTGTAGRAEPAEDFDHSGLAHKVLSNNSGQCCLDDDGLYLTADESYFLGRYE